MKTLAIHDILI